MLTPCAFLTMLRTRMTRHNVIATTLKEKVAKVKTKVIGPPGMPKARIPNAKAKELKVKRVKKFPPMVTKEEKVPKANRLCAIAEYWQGPHS